MAQLSASEHTQVLYALRAHGGDGGKRLAAELEQSLSESSRQLAAELEQSLSESSGQQQQGDTRSGQQEDEQGS